jgi:AICAR transformylase/IMP cyclohydrolase PurH
MSSTSTPSVTGSTRRALLSVSDKSGIRELAQGLVALGFELYSTGGTRKHLEEAGLPVIDVAQYTGFPEVMHGRVKTCTPRFSGAFSAGATRPRTSKRSKTSKSSCSIAWS